MVLYWSCERRVCSSSRPSGSSGYSTGAAVKLALPVAVGKRRSSRGACGRAKPPGRRDAGVEVLEAGDHAGDAVADRGVVLLELLPGRACCRRRGRARARRADDGRLGQQVRARGLQAAAGGVHHAHGVLDGHELLAAAPGGPRSVRPSVGRIRARAPVTACERLSLVDTCTVSAGAAHGGLGDVGVGGGGDEVAAHGEEDLGLAVAQGADGADDVVAVLARRGEAELLLQGVEEGGRGAFEDAHGAVALHVGVAAHRAHAGAGAADVAAQQKEVDDLADGRHGVLVLGEAHRPAHDGALRRPGPWRRASLDLARACRPVAVRVSSQSAARAAAANSS